MKQLSFAAAEHQTKKRVTRREKFLAEMERVVPWAALIETVRPHYFASPASGGTGSGLGARGQVLPFSARGKT